MVIKMNREISVPKIRFYEFSRNWENFKLGSCSEIKAGGTPKTGNPDYWFPKEIPWMSSGEVNKKRLYDTNDKISKNGLDNSSARWIKEKSILIALAGQGKTRGTVAITEIPITTNQSIAAIEVDDTLDSEFVFQNLESRYDELRRISSGDGSRGGLNKQIISEINIIGPQVSEQIKVGKLFKRIDYTIKLQQQLLNDHKQLKKAMLQKMFPQKGESVPRVRFAGFNGDWREKELSELAERFDNLRIPITSSERIAGSTPYYGANGIQGYIEGYTHDGEFILVAEDGANDLKNYPVQHVTGKVWVNNHAHVLSGITGTTDNYFLMNSIKQTNIEPFLVGGGRAKLNANIMMKIKFYIPEIDEQEKVGNFFKQLDETIALHEQKLETYQELKKAMLQKMFV